MRNIVRRLALTGTLALAAASGMTVTTAGTASASGWGCSGNEVSGSPYAVVAATTGAVYSYVHLFYEPSSGDNCAVNVKTGDLYGTPTLTKVKLSVCSDPAPSTSCDGWNLPSQEDPTNNSTLYSYYAGPVTVPGSGHCVAVYAETDRTASDYATYWSGAFHCG